jgi:hypothetical protein
MKLPALAVPDAMQGGATSVVVMAPKTPELTAHLFWPNTLPYG